MTNTNGPSCTSEDAALRNYQVLARSCQARPYCCGSKQQMDAAILRVSYLRDAHCYTAGYPPSEDDEAGRERSAHVLLTTEVLVTHMHAVLGDCLWLACN